jgi:hypothetical protein
MIIIKTWAKWRASEEAWKIECYTKKGGMSSLQFLTLAGSLLTIQIDVAFSVLGLTRVQREYSICD